MDGPPPRPWRRRLVALVVLAISFELAAAIALYAASALGSTRFLVRYYELGDDHRAILEAWLAGRDSIVPPRRTEAVRRAIPALVLDRTIRHAGHDDIFHHADFREAMVEALARVE